MGKDLRGKELGVGLSQREDGLYVGRYTNKYGNRVQKVLPKLQEFRQWLAEAQYQDEHSNIDLPASMTVNAWFEYWISSKKRTVRPNTIRNYTERYHRNIEPVIGNKMLGAVNSIHCQGRYDTKDFTNDTWTFQYWHYNEFVCSYYRGTKT